MLLYRIGPEGFYAAAEPGDARARFVYSDPFAVLPGGWEYGADLELSQASLLAPVLPGKIVGIGRNYRDHAAELGNAMPEEPLLFLKAPSSVIGPNAAVILPPESERVEFEGEIAVVIGERLRRADPEKAASGVLGVTCACDVTARDLQRRDATFARGKSFDAFCPLGPAIWVRPEREVLNRELEVVTRIDGEERQRGSVTEMAWGIAEVVAYVSRFITLEAGDVVLTGTPSGVGPLSDGQRIEVEIPGLGTLTNPVEARREA